MFRHIRTFHLLEIVRLEKELQTLLGKTNKNKRKSEFSKKIAQPVATKSFIPGCNVASESFLIMLEEVRRIGHGSSQSSQFK